MTFDLDRYRELFPHIKEGWVHLNHAGVSPLSTRVAGAMGDWLQLMTTDPHATMAGFGDYIECHNALSRLLGVPAQDVALTKNTAHGLSIIADGLKWRDDDEIVFADCEYPANTYPWLAQEDRGVTCRIIKTRDDGTLALDDFAAAMSPRTRIVAVSWVQFSTGYRTDIEALAELAHAHGALLVVDVIQGLGALPVNIAAAGVDIAATGSQKWLMGPMGVGGLYINPNVLDQLRLVNMGAGSVNNVFAFEPLGFDPKPTAQRYEEGTPNFPGAIGLLASIRLLEEVGLASVWDRIRNTTRYAMEGLKSRGYLVVSPDDDDKRAGIVLFNHPTLPKEPVLAALNDAKVHLVDRGGKIRFAPQFYTSESDIDQALAALPPV
jgi:selenocysteine lyase/cysteine desulfurase